MSGHTFAAASLGGLGPIVARKREEVSTLRCGAATIWARAEQAPPARGLVAALRGGRLIAEMKRRSPSAGILRPGLDPSATAAVYEAAGAAAVSVLTDAVDFGGSLQDLTAVVQGCRLPVLRKDFVVDPLQVAEARVAGADAVLLIAAILTAASLEACLEAARRAGLDALVEVHDADEVARALDAGAACIGINNRDLGTLHTDLATFSQLRPLIPDQVVRVAESGVRTAADVRRLVDEGADAVLVGEVLMRDDDPGARCAEFATAARR